MQLYIPTPTSLTFISSRECWRRLQLSASVYPLVAWALLSFAASAAALGQQTSQFQDVTAACGLPGLGGSACWADVDNDGWTDLCSAGVVWKNDAGQSFSKLAEGLGEVVAADYDNDGWVDLFSWSNLQLWHNEAGQSFRAVPLPELPRTVCLGACWGDFNGDSRVDLYLGGYEDWEAGLTFPDMLLLNEMPNGFRLAWRDERYRARGVTAADFDRDGDLDVYVSNYRLQPNVLWVNDGTGHWEDQAATHNVVATSEGFPGGHSIGAAWGDLDNDGWLDLFAGNFAHRDSRGDQPQSRFLQNRLSSGERSFVDHGPCGVFYQESYASPALADYDNDGDLDLYFTTVYETASFNVPNHPVLFRNDGAWHFADVTTDSGLQGLPATYQAAWGDFDQDGDLDLATAGKLFRNQAAPRSWLNVELRGDGQHVNRSAIGAIVTVRSGDRQWTRQVEAGTGQGNQNDLVLQFGLGDAQQITGVEILWPGGRRQTLASAPLNRRLTLDFPPN